MVYQYEMYTIYTGQDAVTIDSNGIVMCSDQKAFTCLTESCNCKSFQHLLHGFHDGASNVVVNLADKAILSSEVWLRYLRNVSIIGENNFTVLCDRSYIIIQNCNDLTFQGITWIGCGAPHLIYNHGYALMRVGGSFLFIQKNTFQYSFGPALHIFYHSDYRITNCSFMNSNYRGHGAAIYIDDYDPPNTDATIINNYDFSYNEDVKSIIYFGNSHGSYDVYMYFNNTKFYNNQGVSIYLSPNYFVHISGDILFKNNIAENGAGIYISDHSTVVFDENSNVKFINNSVDHNVVQFL